MQFSNACLHNFGAVKALNEIYYIPPKEFEALVQPLKPEDKLTLTGKAISRECLGIADGEVPLHEKIKQIEAMGFEPEAPKLGGVTDDNLLSSSSDVQPLNQPKALTPEKRRELDEANAKKLKAKSRFDDDASY